VKRRLGYLIIAILVTVLHGVVTVRYGTAIWAAWAGDLPARGLIVFFVALEATSVANVGVHSGSGLHALSVNQSATPRQNAMPIAAGARGRSDV
jgi:hypothetical protein